MVVRNLKQSLLRGGSSAAAEPAAARNGNTQQKKTRVAVLISGTGETLKVSSYLQMVVKVFFSLRSLSINHCLHMRGFHVHVLTTRGRPHVDFLNREVDD